MIPRQKIGRAVVGRTLYRCAVCGTFTSDQPPLAPTRRHTPADCVGFLRAVAGRRWPVLLVATQLADRKVGRALSRRWPPAQRLIDRWFAAA